MLVVVLQEHVDENFALGSSGSSHCERWGTEPVRYYRTPLAFGKLSNPEAEVRTVLPEPLR